MGKHSDLSNWQVKAVVTVVAIVAAGLAVYSAAASYETVSHLAATYGVPLARWTPIGLDGGLFGAIIINIGLIWLKKPVWWFGMVARFFAIAVIAANGAAGWPRPIGVGLRVAAPVLFVIIMEAAQYVLLYRTDAAEAERQQKRAERIPFARWVLAPIQTFAIWRRKKLWTDSNLPQSVIDVELSFIRLADFYGADWRDQAEADLVWMVESGVNMDEVLDRVRKLTTVKAVTRKQGSGGNTQVAAAVTPEPALPVTAPATGGAAPVTPPPVTPETDAVGEGLRKRTEGEWLAEVRNLYADQGDALSVRKLMPQLKLLGGGSGIAIATATAMLRQVKAEARAAAGVSDDAGAVG